MRANEDLLTGPDAGDLVAAVLAQAGGRPLEWSVGQVDHQPGGRTTVSYDVRVVWTDGSVTDEALGAASGRLPDGVTRLTDGDTEVGMWRFPFDPDLPGLPAACDPARMSRLVAGLGLGGPATLRVRTYRPRRRAVVEVATPGGTVFVKVLRPEKVRALYELHRVAADAGCPTPAPLGWTEDGLLVLAGLAGRTLRDRLLAGERVDLDPDDVVAVLDGLPAELAAGERRVTWGQKAGHYAEVLATSVPALGARARAVAAAVDHDTPEGPDVPVHGDFYEAQLMVTGGRVSGVLDIDTAGRGERLDDAGCLLAHLAVLALMYPDHAGELNRLRLSLHRRFVRDLDPAALARRTAAVVLSLATGPHRVQEPGWQQATTDRVELAERWLHRG
ncbi:aminoglycoside phosphotransferase family protein [Actinophytocola gossypii]|uniref:Phosphotransferase n=1 Tax=Actinophytocola gossypii TaxID=2812003 RepID=A0ABT2J8Q0_9PSEU|nr:aminoglycoside phosphotransferase family protein [Actinophytocola gossypii]MCT2584243.1 phosphotransferase [Actinophytocola gossypii]